MEQIHKYSSHKEGENTYSLETRLAQWREEQYRVASNVIVMDDQDPLLQAGDLDKRASPPIIENRFKVLAFSDNKTEENDDAVYYGGVDVSFPKDPEDLSIAVYVIVQHNIGGNNSSSRSKVIYCDHEFYRPTVPYLSSYLSFREIDPLERLVKKQLRDRPELTPYAILVDGNGILHERRAGIACFLGVRTGLRTIGIGKTLYCHASLSKRLVQSGLDLAVGDVLAWARSTNTIVIDSEPSSTPSLWQSHPKTTVLIDQLCIDASNSDDGASCDEDTASVAKNDRECRMKELAGVCCGFGVKLKGNDGKIWASALLGHGGQIENRSNRLSSSSSSSSGGGTKNPIFVSVGHLLSLEEATQICAQLSQARIPEPIRQADLLGRTLLREKVANVVISESVK